jgi:hypothetical protein
MTSTKANAKARKEYKDDVRKQVAAKVEDFDQSLIEEGGDLFAAYCDLASYYQGDNPMRILAQDPTVTGLADVAAFGTWIGRGRVVNKGEKSHIQILRVVEFGADEDAPEAKQDAEEESSKRFGVRVISLFHINQTHAVTEAEQAEMLIARAARAEKKRR